MESELKACPFCGGEVEYVSFFVSDRERVQCLTCEASVGGNEAEAIAAWNTRAPDPAERARGFIEGRDAAAGAIPVIFVSETPPEFVERNRGLNEHAAMIRAHILALSPGKAKP